MDDLQVFTAGSTFWKTNTYSCEQQESYTKPHHQIPCQTMNMTWLAETEARALSYGPHNLLKKYTLRADISLWKLMKHTFTFEKAGFGEKQEPGDPLDNTMEMVLKLFNTGSRSRSDTCGTLYSFLSGRGLRDGAKGQLRILEDIQRKLKDPEVSSLRLPARAGQDQSTPLSHLPVTPDGKLLLDVIESYIGIGKEAQKAGKMPDSMDEPQRLSIYIFDQLLLKLMCQQVMSDCRGLQGSIHGWYVDQGTETIWKEKVVVAGEAGEAGEAEERWVSDMGEIALFNVVILNQGWIQRLLRTKTAVEKFMDITGVEDEDTAENFLKDASSKGEHAVNMFLMDHSTIPIDCADIAGPEPEPQADPPHAAIIRPRGKNKSKRRKSRKTRKRKKKKRKQTKLKRKRKQKTRDKFNKRHSVRK